MDIFILNQLSELIFDFGSGQTENTENTRTHIFVYFQFDHFPKSKINSESRFEMKMSILLF